MDSDNDNSDTDIKPKIEDVLLLNEIYESNQKTKKRYYGKKKYKNAKVVASAEITNEVLEKMIIDDLSGQYFPGYVKYFKSHYKDCMDQSMKNSQKSIEARVEANDLFAKKPHTAQDHKDIWELYSKSIAFAPVGSKELVLAYEGRSNLLLHLKKYEDCVKDIERALLVSSFDLLKVKLLCRKMTCFVAMAKTPAEKIQVWEALKFHFEKVDVAFDCNDKFLKMVEQAENESQVQASEIKSEEKYFKPILPPITQEDNFDIVYSRQLRVIAKRDVAPGEVVIHTSPLVTSFLPDQFYAYCSHCLRFMWAGIPCDECSLCMYCSENCKTKAWDEYHILECKILPYINFKDISYYTMHMSTRVFLKAIREFGSVSKLKQKMQEIDELRDESKLDRGFYSSSFLKFYASLLTQIKNSPCNLDYISKLVMKACFLVHSFTQTCDIFETKNYKSLRGKELAKEKDIINSGLIMLKIMIATTRNMKAATQFYQAIPTCDTDTNTTGGIIIQKDMDGTYYDSFNAMLEKSCNPNVAACWTYSGTIIYYCTQPIKKKDKITICNVREFFLLDKNVRDMYTYFSIYCQCTACVKGWPVLKKLFEKTKQRRTKVESKETKIVEKYFKVDQVTGMQIMNREITTESFQQFLKDVNDVVKACGQPSFASSAMIYHLCVIFERLFGSVPLISYIPTGCRNESTK